MTLNEITQKVYKFTKTNSATYLAAQMAIDLNNALERVCSLINIADKRWQWDDSNQTDLPIATTSLVSGQQDYSLATSHYTIDRIEVKDSAGNWTVLTQIDQQEKKRDQKTALAAYQSTNGTPKEYDVIGSSVFLYPAPNYSQTASLKVYFTLGPIQYVAGDLTSTAIIPGFNPLFHILVPLYIAYEYAVANALKNVNGLALQIQRVEDSITTFYGLRNRDSRPRMTISRDSNR